MALQIRTRTTWEVSVNLSILNLILTHFLFLTFLARDLRGLANLKVYFSFVNVSDSLGPSSEHNYEVCQTIKNEINETVKELKSESANRN
jgi:hypothetical protein